MKVAFLSQPFDGILPPYQNSIGISTYETARRIAKTCDVIVYQRAGGYRIESERIDNVQYRSIPVIYDNKFIQFRERRRKKRVSQTFFFSLSSYYFFYALFAAMDLMKQRFDIVQIYNFSQFVPVIRFFNPKIKIILNMRCEWLTQLDHSLIKQRLSYVDRITGCSEYIVNTIRNDFPEHALQCKKIYNGVDIERFTPISEGVQEKKIDSDECIVLFVGRCSPEKGIHILIEAFSKVIDDYPSAKLHIVGSKSKVPYEYLVGLNQRNQKVYDLKKFYQEPNRDSYYVYCKQLADTLGLSNYVIFWGGQPYEKMAEIYQKSDVVVNPSFSESFGRSVIEAMALGKPVIASNVGGMTEILENSNAGILVESGDVSHLSEAIIYCLKNKTSRESMGRAGMNRVKKVFSWDSITTRLHQLFLETLNR